MGGVHGLSGFQAANVFWDGLPASAQSGSGAAVTVTNDAAISAAGAQSTAIMALSVGSGQAAGNVSVTNNAFGTLLAVGANTPALVAESRVYGMRSLPAAASGSVTVQNSGTITAQGASARAVRAESNSATGAAGDVTVTNAAGASIISSGASGVGLYARSFGLTGNGVVTINNAGLIEGGLGGKGILLSGGKTGVQNIVTNSGTIQAGSIRDFAIDIDGDWNSSAPITINNNLGGLIAGSIDPTSSTTFNNALGATFNSGPVITLGPAAIAANVLNNSGVFSPGGLDNVLDATAAAGTYTSVLTGNLTQSATGQIYTDINFATGAAATDYSDRVRVTGTATLGGFVTLNAAVGAGKPGSFSIPILVADGGIIDNGIAIKSTFVSGTPSSTAVFIPGLQIAGNTLSITYGIDYAPPGLTANANRYGTTVNAIQTAGVPAYQVIADELLEIPTLAGLQRAYDSLTGEGVVASQQASLEARGQFFGAVQGEAGALLSCDEAKRKIQPDCQKTERIWVRTQRMNGERIGNPNTATVASAAFSFVGGYERLVHPNFVLGFAAGLIDSSFKVPARWTTGSVTGPQAAAYAVAKSDVGFYAQGLASVGYISNSIDRLALGRSVSGQYNTFSVGGAFELGHEVKLGLLSFTPFAGYVFDRLHQPTWSENNGVYGNKYEALTVKSNSPYGGAQLEARLAVSEGFTLTPFARLGVSSQRTPERWMTASSRAAPGFYWRVEGLEAPNRVVQYDAGLRARFSDTFDLSLKGTRREWSNGASNASELTLWSRF
jgi:outer membrane autotransporter protein